jgi:hypothetical protein
MAGKKPNKKQKKTGKFMTVYWDDASLITYGQVMIKLPLKMTTGEYLGEEKGFIILKNPVTSTLDKKTLNKKKKVFIPDEKPRHNFFWIPSGMIKKQKFIKS